MSNPASGTYKAQVFSQYFCFGNDCNGSNANLNWACNNVACTSVNINGTIPTPKIIPQVGSPVLTVGLPQLSSVTGWAGGTASITNQGSGCVNGSLDSISNEDQWMKFTMSGTNLANFCRNTKISATVETESLTCHKIPYLDILYCYDQNKPHEKGFFDYSSTSMI